MSLKRQSHHIHLRRGRPAVSLLGPGRLFGPDVRIFIYANYKVSQSLLCSHQRAKMDRTRMDVLSPNIREGLTRPPRPPQNLQPGDPLKNAHLALLNVSSDAEWSALSTDLWLRATTADIREKEHKRESSILCAEYCQRKERVSSGCCYSLLHVGFNKNVLKMKNSPY